LAVVRRLLNCRSRAKNCNDQSTLLLMRRFYELWRGTAQLEPAEALREAQIWLRSTPPFDHPYHWASFGYTGA
jgi:CHAT domain-containing protein